MRNPDQIDHFLWISSRLNRYIVPKIREILRLKWKLQLGLREIARSFSIAHSTVLGLIHRAEVAKLSWRLPPDLNDAQLEELP